jgi:MFS family permease
MRRPPAFIIGTLSLALVLGQVAIMAVPAVVLELAEEWRLDAAEIGWLGGIYFAGYAVGLPFLSGAAGRVDGRFAYAASAAIAGLASFAFAVGASGFWSAAGWRFLAGFGFSGIHIVGMKLMIDRLEGDSRARAGAFYSAAYALGSGASFLIAGLSSHMLGWRVTFIAAGAGSLIAIPLLLLIGPPLEGGEVRSTRWFPDYRSALRNREVVRYVIAYAGNTWEVFAIRVWFVPFLAFNAGANSIGETGWPPPVLAGISAILAVPVSLAVAEFALKLGRERVVVAVAFSSFAICLVLGWLATAPYGVVLALLLIHGATSYGDAGAINAGIVATAPPEIRAAALAMFGLFGFTSGFLGPFVVGYALQSAGGASEPTAWLWGFAAMGLGSAVAAAAMTVGRSR